jgi:bifunctional DNase/RNase
MTHDLTKDLLEEIGARIERVTVTELRDATFYAEILVRSGTEVHAVSARPSDAVALAVRFGAPVFAEDSVLDEAARPADEDGLPDDVVEQFRAFIQDVNPEDFAS